MEQIVKLASEYLVFRCTSELLFNTPLPVYAQAKCTLEIPTIVKTTDEIDYSIAERFQDLKGKKLGILLSGGMDSACLASYMPGADAFTFRFEEGKYQTAELERAEKYAEYYHLNLHYVDISWENTVLPFIDVLMKSKGAPVHSIEPQIMQAAVMAKDKGIECMIVGESADLIFGGMDGLLSKDWIISEFIDRYTFCQPQSVMLSPVDISWVFEKYRLPNSEHIDILRFMDEVFSVESSASYTNAFKVVGLEYCDPYAHMQMGIPLDLNRVRNGEPKYLIRALFAGKYPHIPIPNKTPMPRPVDFYFSNWEGPTYSIFKDNINLSEFTGNQKWQMWCLDRYLKTRV